MNQRNPWDTKQILAAFQTSDSQLNSTENGAVFTKIFLKEELIGVGTNSENEAVLIIPGQSSVTAFETKNASFDPWKSFKEINNGISLNDVAVLTCRIDRTSEQNMNAVAATFLGIIDLQLRFGNCGQAIWQMKSLFDSGFTIPKDDHLVTGLIGEIILMLHHPNAQTIFNSWHSHIDDKYDFSNSLVRLDVKSTISGMRNHHFSSSQLPGISPGKTYVASILISKVQTGTSFSSLIELFLQKIDQVNHEFIADMIFKTLHAPPNYFDEYQIDLIDTLNSVHIYSGNAIPTPFGGESILSMNWEASLSGIENLSLDTSVFYKDHFKEMNDQF